MVLRVLEDRSDAEIAEVLGASHAFARAQVQRGLATLHEDLPTRAAWHRGRPLARHAASRTVRVSLVHWLRPTDPAAAAGRSAWVAAIAVLALVVTVALVARATRTPPA